MSNLINRKDNFHATEAPGVDDDMTQGYRPGSYWIDAENTDVHVCVSAAPGAARWLSQKLKTINGDGGSVVIGDVVHMTGVTTSGTGSFVHATADVHKAVETMAIPFSFIPSTPSADEYIWTKGIGTNGWAMYQRTGGAAGVGRLRCLTTTCSILWDYTAEMIGKTMHCLFQRNASVAELWVMGADGIAMRVAEDTAVGADTQNTNGASFGNYQSGLAGSDGVNAATCPIIGGGYGTTFLTRAQVQTYFDACKTQGTVPADSSFPGAVSVYQEANGLENDQVGSNDLTRRENTPGDLVSTTVTPTYIDTQVENVYLQMGQSNNLGQAPTLDFASIGGVNYRVAYTDAGLIRSPDLDVVDVDDSGFATGTGLEVSMSRQLVANGVTFPVIAKRGQNSTGLEDHWIPGEAQYEAFWVWFDEVRGRTLHNYIVRGCTFIGTEADANDAGKASRVAANLALFCDGVEAHLGEAALAADFRHGIIRLSDNQTSRSERATVQAQVDAFVLGRANAFSVNTDAGVYPDNLHGNAATIVGWGLAVADGMDTGANQTMVLPT